MRQISLLIATLAMLMLAPACSLLATGSGDTKPTQTIPTDDLTFFRYIIAAIASNDAATLKPLVDENTKFTASYSGGEGGGDWSEGKMTLAEFLTHRKPLVHATVLNAAGLRMESGRDGVHSLTTIRAVYYYPKSTDSIVNVTVVYKTAGDKHTIVSLKAHEARMLTT